MYTEALHDPKVQRLPATTFKGWINLLMLAKEHEGALPDACDIAFVLRLTDKQTAVLVSELTVAGLLDQTEVGLAPHNWDRRQYALSAGRHAWMAVRRTLAPLVYERDGYACQYCGAADDLTIDHVRPLSRGGSNEMSNLLTACRSCNCSKGSAFEDDD